MWRERRLATTAAYDALVWRAAQLRTACDATRAAAADMRERALVLRAVCRERSAHARDAIDRSLSPAPNPGHGAARAAPHA